MEIEFRMHTSDLGYGSYIRCQGGWRGSGPEKAVFTLSTNTQMFMSGLPA